MKWVLKSGIDAHRCSDYHDLKNCISYSVQGVCMVKGILEWTLNGDQVRSVPIENIHITPGVKTNMISLDVLVKKGFVIKFSKSICEIYRGESMVLSASWCKEEYSINTVYNVKDSETVIANRLENEYMFFKEEVETITDAALIGPREMIQNVIRDEPKLPNMIHKGDNVSDSRVKLTEENNMENTVFDAATVIDVDVGFDESTNPLRETVLNVSNDDRYFSKYECDSLIGSMDIIIINSLSIYDGCEYLKTLDGLKVPNHVYKRSTKTTARSLEHKQCKQPQDSSSVLQPSVHLQDNIVYRGQLDNSANIEKITYRRKKHNPKIVRTFERDLNLQLDEGSVGSNAVLIDKSFLNFDKTTCFMCLDSELDHTVCMTEHVDYGIPTTNELISKNGSLGQNMNNGYFSQLHVDKVLIYSSLCLFLDNFKTLLFVIVEDHDSRFLMVIIYLVILTPRWSYRYKRGILYAHVINPGIPDILKYTFIAFKSSIYFETCQHILKGPQEFNGLFFVLDYIAVCVLGFHDIIANKLHMIWNWKRKKKSQDLKWKL